MSSVTVGLATALATLALLPASTSSASVLGASSRPVTVSTRSVTTGALRTPTSKQVTKGCELLSPAHELGPTSTVPANPVTTTISPSGGVWSLTAAGGLIYVVNGSGLLVYDESGSLEHQYGLPNSIIHATSGGTPVYQNGISQPVVAPSGDVFISSYYGQAVVEIGTSGQVLATLDPNGDNPNNIFALHSSGGAWELGISTTQRTHGSYVYSSAGHPAGSANLRAGQGGFVSLESNGDILYSPGTGFVQTWGTRGDTMLAEFGSGSIHGDGAHTGGPLAFYYADQAVRVDGDIYTADGLPTMTETRPDGLLVGTTTLDNALEFEGYLSVIGRDLIAETGPPFDNVADTISIIPVHDVTSYIEARQPAADVLGWGAGLQTGVTGNYFRYGTNPSVTAHFASWWQQLAPHLKLQYQLWNSSAINAGREPATKTVQLPHSSAGLSSVRIPLGHLSPGPVEIQARLLDTRTSPATQVGSTCMPMAIGAAGDRLDFASLPPGESSGGPADPRGVVLNSELGLTGLRSLQLINWSSLLPDCNPSSPTASTCGQGALQLSNAPEAPFQAAFLADKDHVHYWIQVSGGDPVSLALVNSGYWQGDIQGIVQHYSQVPAGCTRCAPVTEWEPWNEANNTGWSNPALYVSSVLEPFYEGVKAAEPHATVIGGSSLEVDLPWWQGLIAAGGLAYLDVASVHPYPGSDDSWEEDGIPAQLTQLKSALGHVPLWISEVGWWSDGSYDFTQQADYASRALIWQRIIGIPVWNYFIDEGSFGNDGISFSLIQAGNSIDYVKPAGLAVMETTHELAGRKSLGQASTGLPQTWDARFGPTRTSKTETNAVWSDGLATTAALSAGGTKPVAVTVTNQYGSTTSATLRPGQKYALGISDQIVYLTYPDDEGIRIQADDKFSPDLALASAGATATASSGTASSALVDPTDATDYGQGWTSDAGDAHPTLTVQLAKAARINRVVVDTQSVGSVAPGLRSYTVDTESTAGTWRQVASVVGQFREHSQLVAFEPVYAQAVRISISMVNEGGYYGGGLPYFCTESTCPPVAFLHALEVYSGGGSAAQAEGAGLRPL